ncbi:MAG: helix-turn-helix transcriptional regulator [Bacteroidota bacterium]
MEAVFLVGAAQGAFLAAVLASRHRNALPNRLLAGLILAFSIELAMAVYYSSPFSLQYPALTGLDLPVAFLFGPLLYLYARTLSRGEARLERVDLAHAAPFVLCTLFLAPFFLRPGADKLALLADPSLSLQTRALAVINPLKLLHGAVYLSLLVHLLQRYGQHLQESNASVEHTPLRWLRNMTTGLVAMLVVSVLFFVLGGRHTVLGMNPSGFYDDLSLLSVTIFVYAIGYFGLRQPAMTTAAVQEKPDRPAASPAPYARSGMDAEEARRQRDRLVTLMETEHLYRQGTLTLQDLADALQVTPHNLTEVLSTQLDQSFYDFVNGYRVREVQARLTDPAFAHWTVLAIGLEAGFNAKSSFNAAFKRHTGMNPSQYRRRHEEAVRGEAGPGPRAET